MLDKEKLNTERQSLYADIDKTIGDLVSARLSHDTQKEVDVLHMMESLMVQTQQFLDYMGEMFEEKPEKYKVDPMNIPIEQIQLEEAAKIAKREFIARFNWSGNQETGFKEGANWRKEQFLNTADEYIINDDRTVMDFYRSGSVVGKPVVFGSAPEGINVGDKVKVIIVKE